MNSNVLTKPNFFIIGAPKCGTTALSAYLREHPEIFFSEPKEPNFFSQDVAQSKRIQTWQAYLKLFEGSESHKAIGEGTAHYLRSKQAVPEIIKFNPVAQFIVMVRHPADLFHSYYYQLCYNMHENAVSPEEAWRLQECRKNDRCIPQQCPNPSKLQYAQLCSLGEQLEYLYNIVSKDRVLVIFFEDFVNDTRREYERVLHFLGVQNYQAVDFSPVNQRKVLRYPFLFKILRATRKTKKRIGMTTNTGLLEPVVELLHKRNVKTLTKKPALDEQFRQELIEYFSDDIRKLSSLTGRDLSHWLQ
jgi:hypothetical protein